MREVSFFKSKRIKKLQEIIANFDTYPDDVKSLPTHANKVAVYKWLLSYELGWAATTPEKYMEAILNPDNHMYDYHQSNLLFYSAHILYNYSVIFIYTIFEVTL